MQKRGTTMAASAPLIRDNAISAMFAGSTY